MSEQIKKASGMSRWVLGSGVAAFIAVLLLLGQVSGGLKLLGDWRQGDREAIRAEQIHDQQHDALRHLLCSLKNYRAYECE